MPTKITPQSRYDAKHCAFVSLKLNRATDEDILTHLASVSNRQGYIKRLIREDIARTEELLG